MPMPPNTIRDPKLLSRATPTIRTQASSGVTETQCGEGGLSREAAPLGLWPQREAQRDAEAVGPVLQACYADEAARFTDRPDAEAVAAPGADIICQILGGLGRVAHAASHNGEHRRIGLYCPQIGEIAAADRGEDQAGGA